MALDAAAPVRLHPLHALLLAFPVGFFPAALAADITYLNSAEMQWSNFASWAITGALIVGAPALAWSVLRALPGKARGRWIVPLLLAVAWAAGLLNAFGHSRDAWSSVGTTGLLLSVVSTVAILAAGWLAFAAPVRGGLAR
ncbi:DUF2231 domain-containing protein [Sphingomonas corticis]|jgi:uncharacterized membrane protein|uniref:DUF2231 domain-containing protein n=1 Tax=Sphingomonas corticis TaxID=2722791 RepID=A0ABX1CSD2_9SPHN|nr:DUF2231 domain-containing protein [Sphingomonas corticis]NJR79548.1 hypothetical protein [Sphingomonas corticis]